MSLNKSLADLSVGAEAAIAGYCSLPESSFQIRLVELGFLPGQRLRVIHFAPWTKDPMAVELRGSVFALRREDARWILVSEERDA
jgi:ferrous iron transport protein A